MAAEEASLRISMDSTSLVFISDQEPEKGIPSKIIRGLLDAEIELFPLILVEDDERPVFYRLPAKYCRSRFFDGNGLPILEIHTSYFEHITDSDIERRQILKLFPKYVQQTYAGKNGNARWVEIPPS